MERDSRMAPLIISVFALYARPEGNWLSIATVVALMGDLGADHQAVRSSISRLKRRGVLVSEKRGGAAGYALAPATQDVLAEGDVRIFERNRATLEDGWLLAAFSVPESQRDKRHEIRTSLTRLGFGTLNPGVWIAPATIAAEAKHTLERRGLDSYIDLFAGRYVTARELSEEVRSWWNLDELAALYTSFLASYQPALAEARRSGLAPQRAFQLYLPMLTEWRRLPYRDPGLPLSLLPPAWKGESAATLFDELDSQLRPLAREHALALIHRER